MPTIFTRGAASARGFGLFGAAAALPNLWAWGYNGSGQLGLGNTTNYSSPKAVGALATWSEVSAANTYGGGSFCLAIKTDGTLWAWGRNNTGQLGIGNTTTYSSPKQIGALTTWSKTAAGAGGFSLAIKTNGTLWSWGSNAYGQLGFGNTTAYSSPKQIGALTTWSKVSAGARSSLVISTP
jgi:alpha-tubulin suppressor-like RCC1 family protein